MPAKAATSANLDSALELPPTITWAEWKSRVNQLIFATADQPNMQGSMSFKTMVDLALAEDSSPYLQAFLQRVLDYLIFVTVDDLHHYVDESLSEKIHKILENPESLNQILLH